MLSGSVNNDNEQSTPSVIAKRNWDNKLIKNKRGSFKVDKVVIVSGYNPDNDRPRKQLLFIGTFKNRSRHVIQPAEFMTKSTTISTVYKDTSLDMDYVGGADGYRIKGYTKLMVNAGKNILHNQSIQCAVVAQPDTTKYQHTLGSKIKFSILDDEYNEIYTTNLHPETEDVGDIINPFD